MRLFEKLKNIRMKNQASKTEIEYNEEIRISLLKKMAWNKNKKQYSDFKLNVIEVDKQVLSSSKNKDEHLKKEDKKSKLTPEDKEFVLAVAGEDGVKRLEEDYNNQKRETLLEEVSLLPIKLQDDEKAREESKIRLKKARSELYEILKDDYYKD